jgi:hypothetical protein
VKFKLVDADGRSPLPNSTAGISMPRVAALRSPTQKPLRRVAFDDERRNGEIAL